MCLQGPLGPAEMVHALSAAAETHGAEFVADRADAHARVSTPCLSQLQSWCSFPLHGLRVITYAISVPG